MKTKILTWLLGALGFSAMLSSCGDRINTTPDEYGTPYVNFTLKGKVTDQEQTPIKGIKVSLILNEHEVLSDLSDDKGVYLINDPYMSPPGKVHATFADVTVEDIDGPENGSFETQTKPMNLSNVVFTGGKGSWYQGTGEGTLDFVLKPEDQAQQE